MQSPCYQGQSVSGLPFLPVINSAYSLSRRDVVTEHLQCVTLSTWHHQSGSHSTDVNVFRLSILTAPVPSAAITYNPCAVINAICSPSGE